jgi:hypothetical protein
VRPDVPRFGDELGVRQHGVGPGGDEEGVVGVVAEVAAGERRGEVEAEAVDPEGLHPVAQ